MDLKRPSPNPMIPDAREMDDNTENWPRSFQDQNNLGIIKEFSKDQSIPKGMMGSYWGFLAPEVVWANFSPEDEMEWDNLLHLAIQKEKASRPYFEHTPAMDLQFTNLVVASRRKCMRARGADRERVLLATSIQENRVSNTAPKQHSSGRIRGFFQRLMGG